MTEIERKCRFFTVRKNHSPVAQSVEQVAVNHPVGGSNPSGGASATHWKTRVALFYFTSFYLNEDIKTISKIDSDFI